MPQSLLQAVNNLGRQLRFGQLLGRQRVGESLAEHRQAGQLLPGPIVQILANATLLFPRDGQYFALQRPGGGYVAGNGRGADDVALGVLQRRNAQ